MRNRQISAFLMIFVMIVSIVFSSNTAFAAGDGVYISKYVANNGEDIEEGDDFVLELTIRNDSYDIITNVCVSFGSGASFQPLDSGRDQPFANEIKKGDPVPNSYNMFYTGGTDKNLPITIKYKVGDEEKTVSTSIYIRNAKIPDGNNNNNNDGGEPDTRKYKPVLELVSDSIPEGKAGGTISIPIKILNTAKYEAREIKITPALSNLPFIVEQMTVSQVIEKIPAGKSAAIEFKFKIDKNAQEKTYTIPLSITYKNVYGDSFPEDGKTEEIYIKITNTNLPPKLVVREAKTDPAVIKPGENFTLTFNLWNMGTLEAKNVTVDLEPGDSFFALDNVTKKYLMEFKGLNNSEISYGLKAKDKLASGTYVIKVKLDHDDESGVEYPINVIVEGDDEQEVDIITENVKTPQQAVLTEQPFSVTFDIKNIGSTEARDVKITVDSGEKILTQSLNVLTVNSLKPGETVPVSFSFIASEDCESRTYPIKAVIEYKNGQEQVKKEQYIGVPIEGDDSQKGNVDIITENINTPQQAVLTEQPFTVSFDIRNIGSTEAKDVKITVDSGDKILPQSLNVLTVNSLKPDETIPVSFSFIASKDCESKSYPIKAVIEYKDGDEQVKKEQYMGILIESEVGKTTLNTVPKIIISEYSSDPGMVKAGENFTLNMTFLNTSKLKAVQNMKITLVVDEKSEETGGNVFTPVQSSNTFYIDKLEPGETSEKQLVMYTIPDANAKTYVVTAIFEYEYEENDQLKTNKMEDVFGIPVIQPAKLEVTEVIVSEPAYVGEPVYISSEFYNMGRVKLSNLMIKVEGDFDTRESNYFVGNFDIGSGDYYEASITPLNPGETKGKLVYTFEDAAGEEHRIEKEFTVNAMEAEPVVNPFPGDVNPGEWQNPDMPGQKTSKFPLIPVIIGGVVLVGVIVLVIVLKKRKKRKEMMLDEDI